MFWFETVHPETGERLEVEAICFQPRRGRRDEFGAPVEPDEPEAVAVLEAWDRYGYSIDSEGIMTELEAAAWRCLDRET